MNHSWNHFLYNAIVLVFKSCYANSESGTRWKTTGCKSCVLGYCGNHCLGGIVKFSGYQNIIIGYIVHINGFSPVNDNSIFSDINHCSTNWIYHI